MRKIDLWETRRWLEIAVAGDMGIYWTGHLPTDRASNKRLSIISAAMLRLSDAACLHRTLNTRTRANNEGAGSVRLFQRRAATGHGFDYIVRMVRRPTSRQLDRAFATGGLPIGDED